MRPRGFTLSNTTHLRVVRGGGVAAHQDRLQAQCRCSAAVGLHMLPAKAPSVDSHTQCKAAAQRRQAHSTGQSLSALNIIKTLLFSV